MATITMPQLGETVTGGTVTRWLKAVGDHVERDEPLLEVSTDKVDTEIPSAAAGVLRRIVVEAGETVPVGEVLAVIGEDAPLDGSTAAGPDGTARDQRAFRRAMEGGADLYPPLVRPATTVRRPAEPAAPAAPARPVEVVGGPDRDAPPAWQPDPSNVAERIPHSAIRRATAANLTRSLRTAAHTLVTMEVDYSRVEEARRAVADTWRVRHPSGLSYLPFVALSACDALAGHPKLNASYDDEELVVHARVNLGIAVDLDFEGLVVPVVPDAGSLRIAGLADAIAALSAKARGGQLEPQDTSGGTFTITNAGGYGTFVTGPVINAPQVAILSTDGVSPRPVAVPDGDGGHGIAVHPVGHLSLSFDHRAVDGAYASSFLSEVRSRLQERDWTEELGVRRHGA